MINTTKCDLCLFLHKMCCKMVWKFCLIWKILWELAFRWAKFCEILSHSVRYGMYDVRIMFMLNILWNNWIKSGSYIVYWYFLCQNMRNNKNKHSGEVSCCACNAFILACYQTISMCDIWTTLRYSNFT